VFFVVIIVLVAAMLRCALCGLKYILWVYMNKLVIHVGKKFKG